MYDENKCLNKTAIVILPTPLGTGVILMLLKVDVIAEKSISPTHFFLPSLIHSVIPTSIKT